jgi:hypothetical protein
MIKAFASNPMPAHDPRDFRGSAAAVRAPELKDSERILRRMGKAPPQGPRISERPSAARAHLAGAEGASTHLVGVHQLFPDF